MDNETKPLIEVAREGEPVAFPVLRAICARAEEHGWNTAEMGVDFLRYIAAKADAITAENAALRATVARVRKVRDEIEQTHGVAERLCAKTDYTRGSADTREHIMYELKGALEGPRDG